MAAGLVLAVLVAGRAAAQDVRSGVDAHDLFVLPPAESLHSPWLTFTQAPATPGLTGAIVAEFADVNLQRGTRGVALDDVLAVDLAGGASVHDRVRVVGSWSLYLTSAGEIASPSPVGGDLRLAAPITVLRGAVGVMVVPWITAGTGATRSMLGLGGLAGGALAAVDVQVGPLGVAVNAGAEQRPGAVGYEGVVGGPRLVGSVALGADVFPDKVGATAEVRLTPTLDGGDVPVEALVGGRVRLRAGLALNVAASAALSPGIGAANARVLAGVTWAPPRTEPTPRAPSPEIRDADRDGIEDTADACPGRPETRNAWADQDGCPDELARLKIVVQDPDGRGIADAAVFLPGSTRPLRTDGAGTTAFFELVPMTGSSVEVAAEGFAPQTVDLDLVEGPQEVFVILRPSRQDGEGLPEE